MNFVEPVVSPKAAALYVYLTRSAPRFHKRSSDSERLGTRPGSVTCRDVGKMSEFIKVYKQTMSQEFY